MDKINLKIVTLERVIYQNTVERVSIPTQAGIITVLPHHVSLVSLLQPGEMIIHKDGAQVVMAMTTGFFEVRPGNEVVIMADSADRIEEMNIEEIQKAKDRVEKVLKEEQNLSDIDYAHLEDVLSREISRLDIAGRYRRRNLK